MERIIEIFHSDFNTEQKYCVHSSTLMPIFLVIEIELWIL